MQRNFVQVAKFLEEKFPPLRGHITGNVYPMPPLVEFASNILSLVQLLGLAWIFLGGESLLRLLGFKNQLPGFYHTIQANPVPIGMFLFLLAPQFLSRFQANGAFEIYLDGQMIFSKLSAGRFPTGDELVSLVAAAMRTN